MNLYAKAGIALVALVGVSFVAKDTIQTTLFDRSEFLDCFEAEVISDYQLNQLLDQETASAASFSLLSPQIRSNGNQIADFVKEYGLKNTLEEAIEESARARQKRFDDWQGEGALPRKETHAILYDAERICLERQAIW